MVSKNRNGRCAAQDLIFFFCVYDEHLVIYLGVIARVVFFRANPILQSNYGRNNSLMSKSALVN